MDDVISPDLSSVSSFNDSVNNILGLLRHNIEYDLEMRRLGLSLFIEYCTSSILIENLSVDLKEAIAKKKTIGIRLLRDTYHDEDKSRTYWSAAPLMKNEPEASIEIFDLVNLKRNQAQREGRYIKKQPMWSNAPLL